MREGNPFPFARLARGEELVGRERELAQLGAALRERADVLVRAHRGYGASSLAVQAAATARRDGLTVGYVDVRLCREAAELIATLATATARPGGTAGERARPAALVLDGAEQLAKLGAGVPGLVRALLESQPGVAHIVTWGSASGPPDSWSALPPLTLERLPEEALAPFVRSRFALTGRTIDEAALEVLLALTEGHPYAAQELAFFTWAGLEPGAVADAAEIDAALGLVLRAERNALARTWAGATRNERLVLLALADGPASPYAAGTRSRAGLPASTFVQRAISSLVREGLVERAPGRRYRIVDPFLAEWLRRLRARAIGSTEAAA